MIFIINVFKPKIIDCLKNYSGADLKSDLGAGFVVGLVALPLAMAFAIASGLPPGRGLITAVVAGFLISVLGGSRVQIGGPTGAFVVIVSGIVASHGYDGLVMATILGGILMILMGLFRLGGLVKFIPYPVTTGFTSGIAVIIFSGQIKDFFGFRMETVPVEFIDKWRAYLQSIPTINPWAVFVSVLTILIIVFWPVVWRKIPGPVAALVAVTFLTRVMDLPVETIGGRFGSIPHGLPVPVWPDWSWAHIKELFPSAITVALLGSIESLLSAVVADGMIGGHHRSNMELVAQGVANIAAPVFGGIPATGAIARTATNVRNGGKTPIAGIVHAVVLLIVLFTAAPLAEQIPLAALTGILMVVSYHMSEWSSVRFLFQGPASDKVVLVVTFFLTVFIDLTVAVQVGMILSAFLFMKNMAEITEVKAILGEEEKGEGNESLRSLRIPPGVEVFSIRGAFFFGMVHKAMEMDRILSKKPRALLIDMTNVLHIDASGIKALKEIYNQCRSRGVRFLLAGVHSQPHRVLEKSNQIEHFGPENVKKNLSEALASLA